MTSVRVTVADPGGLTAEQQFEAWSVGTTTPPANPNVPRATEKIPSTRLRLGDTARIILSNHFSFWGPMAFEVTPSSDAVSTSVSGDTLTLEGRSLGPAQVTLWARREGGSPRSGAAGHVFKVAVVPLSAPPNRWPVLMKCIDERIMPWFAAVREDVSVYFADPDGDTLTYDVRSEHSDIVQASLAGSTLTLYGTSNARGAFVEVTATDPGGLFTTLEYFVRREGADWYGARRCRSEDSTGTDTASSPAGDLDGGKGGVAR